MRVTWTAQARNDLSQIAAYIKRDNPAAARKVFDTIFQATRSLVDLPLRGRKRAEDEGRELVFPPWPYILVYEVTEQTIYIKAVRHAAQDLH